MREGKRECGLISSNEGLREQKMKGGGVEKVRRSPNLS